VTSEPQPARPLGPYAAASHQYLRAGWAPLPLPYGQKKPVPDGWTGNTGAWPSGPDVQEFVEHRGGGNIALRLPPNVVGVDVDSYAGKIGGAVLADLEQQLGPLPATWRSTSRDDGVSGIRFYRVPEGLRWPGELGPGIEVIRYAHRYAVAWPSLHPDTGNTYRWLNPDGIVTLGDVPAVDDLPALPPTWVDRFTGGLLAHDEARADLAPAAASEWLWERSSGQPCRVMAHVITQGQADLTSGTGSRHDAALAQTNRIVWLAGEGHMGATVALLDARRAFDTATADRPEHGEWERMVNGAIRLAAAAHPVKVAEDPCTNPFAGVVADPYTQLKTNREAPQWHNDSTSRPDAAPATAPSSGQPAPSGVTSASAASMTTTMPSHPSNPNPSLSPTTWPGSPTPPSGQQQPSSDWPIGSTTPESSAPGHPAETAWPTPSEPIELASEAEVDRTSWWPRDVDVALDPDAAEPGPAFLRRDDGQALFYAGRVNGLIAPSESGKTWVALLAVQQAVRDDQRCTILDFEDTHRGIIDRLGAMGVDAATVRSHVAYIGPDEPLSSPAFPAGRDLREHLDTWTPDVIVLDGVNAAMTLLGLELNSNKDATLFSQIVLKPLAASGACVIYVDHTVKDKESTSAGGIGAQAKRAMTTGCAIRINVTRPFGKGQNGTLVLNVDKDRQGDVRGASKPSGETHWAGTAQLVSGADGSVTVYIESPAARIEKRQAAGGFRPTVYMERVAQYIAENPGQGTNLIIGAVRGDEKRIKEALPLLIAEGWVRVEKDGQKSRHYTVKQYSELAEIAPDHATTTEGGTEGGPGVAPSVKNRGWLGVADQDVVLGPTTPGSGVEHPLRVTTEGETAGKRTQTVIAGQAAWLDKATGAVYDTEDGPT
jgi:hypothetical protein